MDKQDKKFVPILSVLAKIEPLVDFRLAFVHRVVEATTLDPEELLKKIEIESKLNRVENRALQSHSLLTATGDGMLQFVTLRVYQVEIRISYEIRANRVSRIFQTSIELVVTVARQPVEKHFSQNFSLFLSPILTSLNFVQHNAINDLSRPFPIKQRSANPRLIFQRRVLRLLSLLLLLLLHVRVIHAR